ncbi:hypothetical protein LPJ72_005136 [Coemansia sp. Benny D160-2]|nr:hypothetical protein LPJ72_005136 [Coemansia sp. Benny D160-2]
MGGGMQQQQQQQLPASAVLYLVASWMLINAVFWIRRRYAKKDQNQNQKQKQKQLPAPLVEAELVSALHVRIFTRATRWAAVRDAGDAETNTTLSRFYATGIYCTATLMLLSLGALAIAGAQIALLLGARIGIGGGTRIVAPADEQPDLAAAAINSSNTPLLLRPVIPGVTLPAAHLAHYAVALGACAVVHEMGHAVAAACVARVRVRRIGVFVLGVYPGAFVDVERAKLATRSLRAQLGVACAGVWHNAVVGAAAWALVGAGALRFLLLAAGWAAVSDGVAVVDVARDSPLAGTLLPLRSVVYRIDDVALADRPAGSWRWWSSPHAPADAVVTGSAVQKWTHVLTATAHNSETAGRGFCARTDENVDDGLCCEMSSRFPLGESPDSGVFCFERHAAADRLSAAAVQLPPPAMCFELGSVLQRSGAMRCERDADCGSSSNSSSNYSVCVAPRSPFRAGRVARVYYRDLLSQDRAMAIYVGSLRDLWLQVQVSALVPPLLPEAADGSADADADSGAGAGVRNLILRLLSRLPAWCETSIQYTLSFSMAFALLNSVPAWHLDGDHVLRLFLAMAVSRIRRRKRSQSHKCPTDGASLRGSPSAEDKSILSGAALRVHRTVTALSTALLAWCVIGSIVVLLVC